MSKQTYVLVGGGGEHDKLSVGCRGWPQAAFIGLAKMIQHLFKQLWHIGVYAAQWREEGRSLGFLGGLPSTIIV